MNNQLTRLYLINYGKYAYQKVIKKENLYGLSLSSIRTSSSSQKHFNTPTMKDLRTESTGGSGGDGNKKGPPNYLNYILLGAGAVGLSFLGIQYAKSSPKQKEEPQVPEVEKDFFEIEDSVVDDQKIPENIPYLIIGGGTAAVSAFRAIKSKEPNAKIIIITGEKEYPYMRPPLSKDIWYNDDESSLKGMNFKQWNGKERSVYFEHQDYYSHVDKVMENENGGIAVIRGKRAMKIDATNKRVYFDDGSETVYEKCLVATGGAPRSLPVFDNAENSVKSKVTLFRGLNDFKKLYNIVEKGKHVTIIGGGFLGSELACCLGFKSVQGKGSVVQIYPEAGNMAKVLPQYLSKWSTNKVRNENVEVITNSYVKSAIEHDGRVKLLLNTDQEIITDQVVVAVGLDPNVELAYTSGLEIDDIHGGFRVNAELEARSNLWVAGDASCFYDIKLGRRRVEHHDHAVVSGRLAGENMTGAGKPYWHQSMFWSDLGPDVGYEAIGIVDSELPTVGVFAKATADDTPKAVVEATGEGLRSETEETSKPVEDSDGKKSDDSSVKDDSVLHTPKEGEEYGKGVIFYLKENIVVGILLWNVFGRMPLARKIIKEGKSYDDMNELAKLFDLYGDK